MESRNRIRPFQPVYARLPNKLDNYTEQLSDDGFGHKAILKIANFTDKNKKQQSCVAQVIWLDWEVKPIFSYDDIADCLYASTKLVADRSYLDQNNVLVRFNQNRVVGIVVNGFKERLAEKSFNLSTLTNYLPF